MCYFFTFQRYFQLLCKHFSCYRRLNYDGIKYGCGSLSEFNSTVFSNGFLGYFYDIFLGTFEHFLGTFFQGTRLLDTFAIRSVCKAVFQGTFLGTFRCFLGTFEHFLGTFGGLSERECQGGSFDVSDVFFDYRVFVACCGPGGDVAVAGEVPETLRYVRAPVHDVVHGHGDDDRSSLEDRMVILEAMGRTGENHP